MSDRKYATGTAVFSFCPDRFVPKGYHECLSIDEILKKISKVKKLTGVELSWPGDFPEGNGEKIRNLTDDNNLEIAMVEIDTSTNPDFKFGVLTNPNEKTRRGFLEYMKKGVDEIEKSGCKKVNLWLGQDGFDYPLQIDYKKNWINLISGIKEITDYNQDLKFCIEYKIKEPRTHCLVSTVGKALLLAMETKNENVGVNIDTGHALMAYENMAESAVILSLYNKLFHLHVNDNFRTWDDDMAVGSVHLWETLELFYWLDEIGYDSWFSLDLFPYREGWEDISIQSIENMEIISEIVSKFDRQKLKEIILRNDSMSMVRFLREEVLKKAF